MAKTCSTNILVMAKTLVFVWMVAKILACQWLFGQSGSFFLPLANSWATKRSTKILGSQIFGGATLG
jgi:hypothetical protein